MCHHHGEGAVWGSESLGGLQGSFLQRRARRCQGRLTSLGPSPTGSVLQSEPLTPSFSQQPWVMTGGHTAAATSSSHVFPTLQQLQVGHGLAQPLGRSVGSWKGMLRGAAASCALESFSPSHAVLGQGELLWGVTGISRPTE